MTQPEGSGNQERPTLPFYLEARDGSPFVLIDNVAYEMIFEPPPPRPRVAAFSGRHNMLGGNAWEQAARLHENPFDTKPKVDPETGEELTPEPTPSPEERKHALRRLVQQRFEDAANDELMQSYADRTDNNEAVQAKVDAWRKEKETKKAELAGARAEWQANRAQKEWSM